MLDTYNKLENQQSELYLLTLEDENFIVKKRFASNQHDLLEKTIIKFKPIFKKLIKREQKIKYIQIYDSSDDELENMINDFNCDNKNYNIL